LISPNRIADKIFKVVEALAIVLFVLVFLVILSQIVLRYVFNNPLVWSDEFAQYAFIWLCFIGWLMASRNREHIAITSLIGRLPDSTRRKPLIVFELVSMLFSCVLLVQGIAITGRNISVATASLFFPFAVVYAIVPVAFAIALLVSVANITELYSDASHDDRSEEGGTHS
jgi:TRAP-type C4-dicarboxylate transport system permease small subunit